MEPAENAATRQSLRALGEVLEAPVVNIVFLIWTGRQEIPILQQA